MLGTLLSATGACKALDVNVRLISAKDGRPIVYSRVHLTVDGPAVPPRTSGVIIDYGWAFTDHSGRAVLHIDRNVPPGAWFLIDYVKHLCSPDRYSADEVMRTGVSVELPCPHRPKEKFVVPAQPGEIVLYTAD